MIHSILVVCRGNICRSPVAAAMLQRQLPRCRVSSAGLAALTDRGVEPSARALAEAEGLDVSRHAARQLEAQHLMEADLVLVMSEEQRREITERWPQAMGKVMRLGHWLAQGQGCDIPDPYRRSVETFRQTHQLLGDAAREWIRRL
ncbi:MAG: low molecular weight phosphotyrosine protein phosphatase [Halomonas sp.]|jgi:protein-tyrosine phosphatase|uniref:protein-tyrosine-phosphatase n=1 Tax=Billgrantia tianxiuensis TaxID=2497861 RepID=A0A6I6SLD0_9GAMM|nr:MULTISPECIES: low molecular weight protein-tyrosine-phosphatase [Halomonas]MCE8035052.1 low molecular weight phosphotyrosine protein phosphatase [Halomonas sp. MCCC 1A11057]MDX5434710.1 low molecular weight phosphotyrosine protein phosphatase [Halomonas sp.]QHC48447.1 low molecular weight phosphotyrosine protein phosphatase [Halomonas tianxiuensis]